MTQAHDPRPAPKFPAPKFPAPEFPQGPVPLFATTPPAIFAPLLGLIGLGLGLRQMALALGFGSGLAELFLGLTAGLWAFAILAILTKILRRPAVLAEDLRPLPGRAGMAAAAMGSMAMGSVLLPHAPGLALVLVLAGLGAHLVLAALVIATMRGQGAEGAVPNPTWHLSFTGIVVAVLPLVGLGWVGLAQALAWTALGLAFVIWGLSLRQILREVPPKPLRPLLAIHLAPAALLSQSFGALGHEALQMGFLALAVVLALVMLAFARWILAAGFSALWGALTFPLSAFALALSAWEPMVGGLMTLLALGIVPWIAWRVLRLWPRGKLARLSNAARA